MLRVFAMLTGDKYAPEYADKLWRAVESNLERDHEFWLITDKDPRLFKLYGEPGTKIIPPLYPEFGGWWQKLGLFYFTGPALWLDLDVVITGRLDPLCETRADVRTALNWAQSGHGGCQSSVMFWQKADRVLWEFIRSRNATPQRYPWPPRNESGCLWGDQEFLTELRDHGKLAVDYHAEELVRSYKYHCRAGLPDGASVIVFHGKPDPHDVPDPWVLEHWQ